MPKTADITKLCILCFSYTFLPMMQFSLQIRHRKILTAIFNYKIEYLKQYTKIKVTGMWSFSLSLSLIISNRTVLTLLLMMTWDDKISGNEIKWGEWHRLCDPALRHYWRLMTCQKKHHLPPDHDWPRMTETVESKTADKGGNHCNCYRL